MNIIFWHPATLYLFSCLSYFPTAVCVFASPPPPTSPVPFAHYLSPSGFDWIFSRGRNVSTKWIRRNIAFRQARSNFSFNKREPLSLSFLPSSHLFLAADRPFLTRFLSLFRFSFHDFRLYLKSFPIKHARHSYTRIKGLYLFESYRTRTIFTNS